MLLDVLDLPLYTKEKFIRSISRYCIETMKELPSGLNKENRCSWSRIVDDNDPPNGHIHVPFLNYCKSTNPRLKLHVALPSFSCTSFFNPLIQFLFVQFQFYFLRDMIISLYMA